MTNIHQLENKMRSLKLSGMLDTLNLRLTPDTMETLTGRRIIQHAQQKAGSMPGGGAGRSSKAIAVVVKNSGENLVGELGVTALVANQELLVITADPVCHWLPAKYAGKRQVGQVNCCLKRSALADGTLFSLGKNGRFTACGYIPAAPFESVPSLPQPIR